MARKKSTDSQETINNSEKAGGYSPSDIARQNELLNGLLDSIKDMIFCKDTAGRYIICNKAFAEHFGLDKAKIPGRTDFDLYPPKNAELYWNNDQIVLKQNKRRINEEWVSCPDGRRILIEMCKTPYRGQDGKLLGIIGVSRDVTERKYIEERSQQTGYELQQMVARRTQELVKANKKLQREISEGEKKAAALRESEKKYRLIVDNSYDLIWKMNAEGVFTYLSPSFRKIMGYEPSAIATKSFRDVVHPDDQAFCEYHINKSIRRKEQINGQEYRVRHGDGAWRWHSTTGVPVFAADGSFLYIVGISRDVTEKKQAEQALKDSRQQLSDIIDFLPDATCVTDNDNKVIAWNRAIEEMTGIRKENIVGQGNYIDTIPFYGERRPHLMDLIDVDDKELESKYLNIRRRGKTLYAETFTPALYGGKGAYLWATAAPLFDVQGNRMGAIESIRDITDKKLIEEELLWKEAFLEAQVEATLDGILVVDCEGQIILKNQNFLDMWEAPQHLSSDKDSARLLQYVTTIIRYPEKFLTEIKYLYDHPNETSRDEIELKNGMILERHSSPVLGKDGKYYGRIWRFSDITALKKAVDELKESQQKLSNIIDFLPDATFVIDKDGKVIAWNRAIEEMTGIKAADMLNKGDYEYALPFYGERRPILIDLVLKPRADIEVRYMRTQRDDLVMEAEAYMPALKDGNIYLYGKASILRDSKGNIVGSIESIRDITVRHRAQEEYKAIFENAVMGIYRATPEGRIIIANPALARILGYDSPAELVDAVIDKTLQLYVYPEQRLELLQIMNEFDTIQEREIQFFRKDRSIAWVTLNAHAVRDGSGKVIYYEGALQDITEYKTLEAQLRQAQKMEAIGTLAGGIAHDFNNILSAVIGYAEMALKETKANDCCRRYLEQIYKAGIRAGDLVKQILTFSRRTDEKLYPLKISPIVKEVLKLLRSSLPATIEISQKIKSDQDIVIANPSYIHQIMMNLCANSAHAIGARKGILEVRLEPVKINPEDVLTYGLTPGMYIKLAVSDTGQGIPSGMINKIFDPFFTTKKPGEGTGMGLSVVHGIVKRCGGTITVQSEVEKGTEFDVYFPLLTDIKAARQKDDATHIAGGRESILFVDDEEDLAELGKSMLTALGYQIASSTSSLDALELFRNHPDRFDLVITDMTMPNMTGLELARFLKLIRPDIPIILCTGFSEQITPDRLKFLGLREPVMKPIILKQLAQSIRRELDRKKSLEKGYNNGKNPDNR